MENKLAFYKHMALDQKNQIEVLEWDFVLLRSWAVEEAAGAGLYLAQRDWDKAQVDGLEARFSQQLEKFPLQMPFRPVWKALSEEERAELRQDETGGQDPRYDAYSAVREAYLNAPPSDHEVLAEQVARQASAVREWRAAETLRAENQPRARAKEPAPPASWTAVVPQLSAVVSKKDQGVTFREGGTETLSQRQYKVENEAEAGSPGSWETVDGALEGYAWNSPRLFSSLEDSD